MAAFAFNEIYTYLRKYEQTIISHCFQNIEKTLKQNRKFEGVLHPVFGIDRFHSQNRKIHTGWQMFEPK